MASTNSSPGGTGGPVISVSTDNLGTAPPRLPTGALSPSGLPEPEGTLVHEPGNAGAVEGTDPTSGTGVEGEVDIWAARYSRRNFLGRLAFRIVLTAAWIALASWTWSQNPVRTATITWIALGVLVFLWLALGYRMIQAHYSHYYRLTNRRLFVSTGVFHRRRDMLELLRVKDVFTRQQSLLERWLGLGTVVVESNEKELPTFYLAGVDDPKQVMDLIWHHARSERDHRSVKIDSV